MEGGAFAGGKRSINTSLRTWKGLDFWNGAGCVEQTGSRSRSSSEARRVSVGSALVHLVRSALTKPASLVAESEEGSEFRAVGRNGKLCAHCVVVGAQGGGGGGRGRRKGSGLVSWNAFLLHGVMGSTFSWRRVQAGVAEMFGGQTVSFDRPPFGLSSRPRPIAWALSGESMNPYSLDFGSELTMNVMDAFKAQSAVLIGHSMGAAVAIQTAIDHPERVRALVLIAPASRVSKSRIPVPNIVRTLLSVPILASLLFFLAHGRTATCRVAFQNSISRYYHDTTKIDIDELFFGYTRAMRHSGWVRAGIACVRAMQEYDCMKEVHRLKIPVLIVAARHDRIVPYEEVEALAKAIPQARLRVMENCGHNPHEEAPEELLSIIDDWIQSTAVHM